MSGLVLVGTGTGAQIRKQKLPLSRHAEDQYLRIVLSCFGSIFLFPKHLLLFVEFNTMQIFSFEFHFQEIIWQYVPNV